jgi:hypothetical protein
MGNTYSFENGFIWIRLAPANGFSQALFLKVALEQAGLIDQKSPPSLIGHYTVISTRQWGCMQLRT